MTVIDALPAAIQPMICPAAATIELVVHALSATIQVAVYPITFAIEPRGQLLMTKVFRPV